MSDQYDNLDQIIEAAIFAAGEPLSAERCQQMFAWAGRPSIKEIKDSIESVRNSMEGRGIELTEVASGYRFQVKPEYAEYFQRLWEKKPPRYSRALLETLALIVYRQPTTRGEIEDVRGVAVSTNIMRILQDREWIKVVGTRDVPGKPALFGTTKQFLDDFNLKSLQELPPLQDIMDLEKLEERLGIKLEKPPETESSDADSESTEDATSENQHDDASTEADTEVEALEIQLDDASTETDTEVEALENQLDETLTEINIESTEDEASENHLDERLVEAECSENEIELAENDTLETEPRTQ